MVDKLYEYQGCVGRFHEIRENIRDSYDTWKENNPNGVQGYVKNLVSHRTDMNDVDDDNGPVNQVYSHIFRPKTRKELVQLSAAVMGIEFSYAAETAFVSPTLLKIGVPHKHMTLVWALSPLIGFFVTPILGSLSDRCKLPWGRRRPFILLLAIGIFSGLILVPNGETIGYWMGDAHPQEMDMNVTVTSGTVKESHPWGIFFTIIGTVLLDFDADACQSPSRTYLLDVTVPEDHAKGLSTFTIMAGLGGFMGYALGGINWDVTFIGTLFGGHVRAVFTLITVIFVACVSCTLTSFREIPLGVLERAADGDDETEVIKVRTRKVSYGTSPEVNPPDPTTIPILLVDGNPEINSTGNQNQPEREPIDTQEIPSLGKYLQSIIFMPTSLRLLCLTNLFCWMAHVCYSLYFTDFVGEAVFGGDPKAPDGSESMQLYEEGVRFGCWGMSMYSLSCACYSTIIERLIKRFRARRVYVYGILTYCCGMALMALTRTKVSVILFSWSAGVMYSTLFTMPYLILAYYHSNGLFEGTTSDSHERKQIRGLGTDVAIVSSMVFLAQFLLSIVMGNIVSYLGTTTAVVIVASVLSFCGALSATQVTYLDL